MKLSELDKNKLPVKVVNIIEKAIYTVKFIDVKVAFLIDEHGDGDVFAADCDYWSPYQEPKTKVALYAYKGKAAERWIITGLMYKDEADAKRVLDLNDDYELKRLIWSEVEV